MTKFARVIVLLIALVALALAGCEDRGAETPAIPGDEPADELPMEERPEAALPPEVDELAATLAAAGLTVSAAQSNAVGFFDMMPAVITANDQPIEVYIYPNAEAAGGPAATIPDLLATTRWSAPPHFYQQDNMIVFYLGEDAAITGALEGQLGAEIAGAPTGPDGDAESVSQVNIYLIALEDNGATGDVIGCGDSIIPVVRDIPPTASPIEAALTDMLSIKDQYYGESGLYNALYQSDLVVESATLENGLATVHLTGQFVLGGVCDNPRFQSQLEYTVLQFPGVEAVEIYINNQPLSDLLTGEG